MADVTGGATGKDPDRDSAERRLNLPEYTEGEVRLGWLVRRREKVLAEIERNRRGEYRVPTWVLTAILVAFVAGFAILLLFVR
jgi:hypothetical protein